MVLDISIDKCVCVEGGGLLAILLKYSYNFSINCITVNVNEYKLLVRIGWSFN